MWGRKTRREVNSIGKTPKSSILSSSFALAYIEIEFSGFLYSDCLIYNKLIQFLLIFNQVWFRRGTWGDDMYGNVQSSVGSMWVEMVGEMVHIAVSANDQVFLVLVLIY